MVASRQLVFDFENEQPTARYDDRPLSALAAAALQISLRSYARPNDAERIMLTLRQRGGAPVVDSYHCARDNRNFFLSGTALGREARAWCRLLDLPPAGPEQPLLVEVVFADCRAAAGAAR